MGEVKRCRPRDVELTALQVKLGETTKRQILDFCPGANVGVPWRPEDHVDEEYPDITGMDSTDLRWVMVPSPDPDDDNCHAFIPVHDTSWILRGVTGQFFVVPDWRYQQTYEEIRGDGGTSPFGTPYTPRDEGWGLSWSGRWHLIKTAGPDNTGYGGGLAVCGTTVYTQPAITEHRHPGHLLAIVEGKHGATPCKKCLKWIEKDET